MVEANRTVVIPLCVQKGSKSDFHQTILPYAYCQQQAVNHCWPDTLKQPDDLQTSKQAAEDALYDRLRDDTNEQLHSNLVQKAIKDATSAISSCKTSWENGDRISKPDFYDRDRAGYTITYDKRAATYSRYEATFSTLNGTVTCRYELPAELDETPYGEYVLDRRWSFSTSKLVFDGDRFWLHAVMQRQFGDDPVYAPMTDDSGSDTHEDTHRVLGVDLNVDGATAVTSTGQFYGNADAFNAYRSEQEQLRGELQQRGTRSAHLRFQQRRGVEWRYYDQYAHHVANSIKQEALRVHATHVAFENLTRIRKRISNLPKFQQWLFNKVRKYTEYKLERYGVTVETTKPAHTSQACSRTDCDCVDENNRDGKQFECLECGYTVNSDYNAAKNIGFRYLSEELSSPASRTCSSGQATSQLALVSGTLSPPGDFAEYEWVSTDKPHPQQASESSDSERSRVG
jgi:IS605 OrfB family transposase